MREGEPYLHHEYVGKFQVPSCRSMARPGERCDWVGGERIQEVEEQEEEEEESNNANGGTQSSEMLVDPPYVASGAETVDHTDAPNDA
ncbi:hypothetical protein RchiOBHm_Chr6g0308841 [Rosa chinensis]|uniref:Uncharacterized protein n=1 Tax=Rosa chinensis TaxID=74649 RepID=A0A2P6Q0R8_ROSCH|nr:hypothetical protein RchiOBHm_Chr6g0308841 [Rosa chinensis]